MNMLFETVNMCCSLGLFVFFYTYTQYLIWLNVLIGDRLEKSVLSLMGLMRTDPPFLRRKIRGLKKNRARKKERKL